MALSEQQLTDDLRRAMKARDINTVCTIPDGGLTQLLRLVEADRDMRLVTMSTEEEGMGLVTGLAGTGGRTIKPPDSRQRRSRASMSSTS